MLPYLKFKMVKWDVNQSGQNKTMITMLNFISFTYHGYTVLLLLEKQTKQQKTY